MGKDEILRKVVPNNCYWEDNFDNVPRHYIETAMDQYASQEGQAFAEWIIETERCLPILSQPISELYKLFKTNP